jgi:hypothetical protein
VATAEGGEMEEEGVVGTEKAAAVIYIAKNDCAVRRVLRVMSSYCCACVFLILLYMCVLILLYMCSSYCCICVCVLLPAHAAENVPSYCCMCVPSFCWICRPHNAECVPSYCDIR